MKKLYERMQNNLEISFIEFLNDVEYDLINKHHYSDAKIYTFLGGSQRFGYATKKSDTDFFVYVYGLLNPFDNINSPLTLIDDFRGYMYFNDFRIDSNDHEHYPDADFLFKHKYQNIHVVVILSESAWETLEYRHKRIAKYLEDNPQVVSFIKELKTRIPDIKGSAIYKILFSLSL